MNAVRHTRISLRKTRSGSLAERPRVESLEELGDRGVEFAEEKNVR